MRFLICFLLFATTVFAQDFRKSNIQLSVTKNGSPVSTTLTVTQSRQSFDLGANNSAIKDETTFSLFSKAFNTVNLLTFWTSLDTGTTDGLNGSYGNVGVYNYLMNEFHSRGMKVNAHPILYNLSIVKPSWITNDELSFRSHTLWWTQNFNLIETVDVLNEPFHNPVNFNWVQCYDWAKSGNPNLKRRINEYGLLTGEITDQFISNLKNISDKYEVIGIQCHIFAPQNVLPSIDFIQSNIRKIATLGKPIHISEVSIPSNNYNWTETSQKDFLISLYTMFFNEPSISGIFYWDLNDSGAWNPTSGLWHSDGSTKPAWDALVSLNNTWKTNTSVRIKNGKGAFTGFNGTYKINGKEYSTDNPKWAIKL